VLKNCLNGLESSSPSGYSVFNFGPFFIVKVSLSTCFDDYFFVYLINSSINDIVVNRFDAPFFNVISWDLQKRNEFAKLDNFSRSNIVSVGLLTERTDLDVLFLLGGVISRNGILIHHSFIFAQVFTESVDIFLYEELKEAI
jgi:hypothetical protein